MSHLQYTAKSHHLQWNVHQLSQICHRFYQNYCPDSFKHRHNVSLAKVSDESILILLLLQAELGITSQRHFYSICHLFPCGQLLERSRFNCRSKQLIWLVQLIRKAMSEMLPSDKLAIIDSFPLPLCQSVRNHRATVFLKAQPILATMPLNIFSSTSSKFGSLSTVVGGKEPPFLEYLITKQDTFK